MILLILILYGTVREGIQFKTGKKEVWDMMKLSFVGTGEQKEKTKQQKPKEVFFFIIVKKKI